MCTQLALFAVPFHQLFFVEDHRIQYPHAEVERVSVRKFFLFYIYIAQKSLSLNTHSVMNFVYALFIPLGIMIAFNFFTRASSHKHEVTYLCFAIALVTTSFITDVIKNAVGRPRPDLLARCKPQDDTPTDSLVTVDVCTETEHHLLHDGWRSFPSGHSSFAFAGLGFLSLFFAGQLHVFRHETGGRDLSRSLICLVPLLGAALIAISRCEDYRHDVYDVCVGSLLGYTVGYWSYRRHWPRLTARDCHEPYPYPGATRSDWTRLRDEEEGEQTPAGVGIVLPPLDLERD